MNTFRRQERIYTKLLFSWVGQRQEAICQAAKTPLQLGTTNLSFILFFLLLVTSTGLLPWTGGLQGLGEFQISWTDPHVCVTNHSLHWRTRQISLLLNLWYQLLLPWSQRVFLARFTQHLQMSSPASLKHSLSQQRVWALFITPIISHGLHWVSKLGLKETNHWFPSSHKGRKTGRQTG